jgi:hypothetical protein
VRYLDIFINVDENRTATELKPIYKLSAALGEAITSDKLLFIGNIFVIFILL